MSDRSGMMIRVLEYCTEGSGVKKVKAEDIRDAEDEVHGS